MEPEEKIKRGIPENLPKDDIELLRICSHWLYHYRGNHSQNRIIRCLARKKEISQKTLQERLHIQAGSMSEVIAKLAEKGYLIQEKSETDKRKMVLKITEKGEEYWNQNKVDEEKVLLTNILTESEQESLSELLQKLLKGWSELSVKQEKEGERKC